MYRDWAKERWLYECGYSDFFFGIGHGGSFVMRERERERKKERKGRSCDGGGRGREADLMVDRGAHGADE